MTIRITLICDCDGGACTCGAQYSTGIEWSSTLEEWAEARDAAAEAGWTTDGKWDYCPPCSRRRHQRSAGSVARPSDSSLPPLASDPEADAWADRVLDRLSGGDG